MKARAGWGVPGKYPSIPAKAQAGWGVPAEGYGYPLPEARAGRGCQQKRMGILLRRRGRRGAAGRERMG